jgi:transcriptional regulator with XRE-family HTH domain
MSHNIVISPAQCKAGRDLLGWTQQDLKEYSGIGINTIATFEKGSRSFTIKTMEKLVDAFYQHGIRFENNEKEIVVRLLLNHNL